MEKRRVEVETCESEWVVVDGLNEVRKDDRFRMFEPDGKPVVHDGRTVFLATGDGYLENEIGKVEAK